MTKLGKLIRVGAAKTLTQGGLFGYYESKAPIDRFMP